MDDIVETKAESGGLTPEVSEYLKPKLGEKKLTIMDPDYSGDKFNQSKTPHDHMAPEALLIEIADDIENGGETGRLAQRAFEEVKTLTYEKAAEAGVKVDPEIVFPTRITHRTIKGFGLSLEPPPGVTNLPAGSSREV